jgi:hypothetical protein
MPTRYPTDYDVTYLELGRRDLEAGGVYPLNPRDRSISDYRLADALWLANLALHTQWIAYEADLLKDNEPDP